MCLPCKRWCPKNPDTTLNGFGVKRYRFFAERLGGKPEALWPWIHFIPRFVIIKTIVCILTMMSINGDRDGEAMDAGVVEAGGGQCPGCVVRVRFEVSAEIRVVATLRQLGRSHKRLLRNMPKSKIRKTRKETPMPAGHGTVAPMRQMPDVSRDKMSARAGYEKGFCVKQYFGEQHRQAKAVVFKICCSGSPSGSFSRMMRFQVSISTPVNKMGTCPRTIGPFLSTRARIFAHKKRIDACTSLPRYFCPVLWLQGSLPGRRQC